MNTLLATGASLARERLAPPLSAAFHRYEAVASHDLRARLAGALVGGLVIGRAVRRLGR